MKKLLLITFYNLLLCTAIFAQNPCPNLVTNGDFELGNTGFTSGLTPSCACTSGSYCVSTNFNLKCTGWPNFGGKGGSGNFFIVDGNSAAATNVWNTSVPVSPGNQYTFSFWVASVYPAAQQSFDLGMMVNGQNVYQFTVSQQTPTWTQYSYTGTCPAGVTNLPIAIRQISAGGFRDFGIDCVEFLSCACEADFSIIDLDNCGHFEFLNTSTGGSNLTYSWNFGDGNTSNQQSVSHQFTQCGTYTVCLTISGSGCTSSQCYNVSVIDNTPPVAVCQPGVGVDLGGNCTFPVTTAMIDGGSTDDCKIQSLSVNPNVLGSCGVHIITLTVTDWCGNTSTCTTGIQTAEGTPPVITCPPNSTIGTSPGDCFYSGAIPMPVATDNCSTPTVVCSLLTSTQSILITPQTVFPKGINTITCFAQDNCENVSPNCTYTLTVVDNQPPVITCPPTIAMVGQINPAGLCSRTINQIAPVVTDNCPMVSVNYAITGGTSGTGSNDASGTLFTGTSTVTYTATDMGGNTSTCSTIIYITCDTCACDGNVAAQNQIANGSFTLGNTGFSSGLSQGNCTTGSYGVYPNFNGYCASWPNRPAHSAPNCLMLDGSTAPGATVLWQSPVTIVPNMDYCFSFWWACAIISPTQSFPITIDIVDAAGIPVTGIPSIGTQLIDQNPLTGWQQTVLPWNSGPATGSYYVAIRQASGSIYRDFGIDDICFNKVPPAPICTCGTFSGMTYRPSQGAPNIAVDCGDTLIANCGAPINWTLGGTFACQGNSCPPTIPMYWTLTGPTGSTPQTGTMSGPLFNLSLPPSYFNIGGTYQLTLAGICGSDTCYCHFVINATCPCDADFAINALNNCGNLEFINTSAGPGGMSVNWNFGDGTTSTQSNPTHQFTHCGTYTVCLTISGNGCTSTQCYTVTVVDNTPPVALCALGFGVTLDANCMYNVTTAMINAGSTDNCQIQSMSVSPAVLTGCQNHTITLTVTDWCGNTSTCTTGIQTTEVIPPVIICPPNSTVSTSPGLCYYAGAIQMPTATDNCSTPTIVCSLLTATQSILITPQTEFPKGVNTITCYAQDDCGNVSLNCTYTLTVVDSQPPVITCPPTITLLGQLNAAGLCERTIDQITPVVTDNCPMVGVNYTISGGTTGTGANDASGTLFTGTSTVIYTATDMGGNTSTCSTIINITCDTCACDGEKPSPNLITNSSFTLGNTGFSSGLTPGNCVTGSYGVYSNFNVYCSSWPNQPAHTAPNCLLIDGSTAPSATVLWQSPVTIAPNMDYCFSFWWASAIISPTQSFPITIDIVDAAGIPVTGIPSIGTQLIDQNPLTGWQQTTLPWNSGPATGNYYVAIRQTSGSLYRDFGIDDICFIKKCDSIQLETKLTGDFPFNGISNSPPQQVITDNTNTANGTGYDITFNQNSTAHFNGSSSWIDGTTNSRGVTSEVSVVAWVKTTEQQNGQWIAGHYDGTAGDNGYLLTIGNVNNNNIGRANFSGRDGTNTYHNSGNSTTLVNDGAWHCIAGTAGGQEWKVYVDGQLENSAAGSTIFLTPAAYPFTIGKTSDPNLPALWMNGDLDDVRVYNRVLTICEIDSVCTTNSVSAVVDPTSHSPLLLYPNPNTGAFTLELPTPAEPGTHFRITDLTGRVIWEKQADTGSQQQAIQTSNLPNGLYFLQVISEGRILGVERFVKQ